MKRKSTEISEEEIVKYLVKKSQKKTTGVFAWKKKIKRDVALGLPVLDTLMSPMRQRERMEEIEKLKKKREERSLEKARHEEERALLARERARAEFQEWEKKEDEFDFQQRKIKSEIKLEGPNEEAIDPVEDMIMLERERMKPKYFARVHSGYEWNKYNRTHYDHDSPPPKSVQGYKFDIFYPDLMDKSKAPTYVFEKDGNNLDACIIRFCAGPPYEDIAFRIPNKDWDYSAKKGFKCTYERGILHLYFNFQHHCYRK